MRKSGFRIPPAVIVILAGILAFNIGNYVGGQEASVPARTRARNLYEFDINDLQKQIDNAAEEHKLQLASLQEKNLTEIRSLEQANTSAAGTLERDHFQKINALNAEHVYFIDIRQVEYNLELLAERDVFYLKGQVDARDNMQNRIAEKHNNNIINNDWNAPVYSIRRR